MATAPSLSTYERLAHRIHRLITHHHARKVQRATIRRCPDEPLRDWQRLLQEFESTDGVQVVENSDASVTLSWKDFCDT